MTGKRGKSCIKPPEATDREQRHLTASLSALVAPIKPRSRKGITYPNVPSKARNAMDKLDKLIEIGIEDTQQSKNSLKSFIAQYRLDR